MESSPPQSVPSPSQAARAVPWFVVAIAVCFPPAALWTFLPGHSTRARLVSVLWVAFALFIFTLPPAEEPMEAQAAPPPQAETSAPARDLAAIGWDYVQAPWWIRVHGSERLPEVGEAQAASDSEFIRVRLTLKNTATRPMVPSTAQFELVSPTDVVYSVSERCWLDDSLQAVDHQPESARDWSLCFEVPSSRAEWGLRIRRGTLPAMLLAIE